MRDIINKFGWEYFQFLRDIELTVGIMILLAIMGLMWAADLEKSPWIFFPCLVLLFVFLHFGIKG